MFDALQGGAGTIVDDGWRGGRGLLLKKAAQIRDDQPLTKFAGRPFFFYSQAGTTCFLVSGKLYRQAGILRECPGMVMHVY